MPGIPAIQILDQGLRIYRRHFAIFFVVALVWLIPLVLVTLFALPLDELDSLWFGPGLGLTGSAWSLLLGVAFLYVPFMLLFVSPLAALIVLLLGLGMIAALSGVIVDLEGESGPTWRRVWRVRPGQVLGMAVTSFLYLIVVVIAMFALACVCGLLMQALVAILENLRFDWLGDRWEVLGTLLVAFGAASMLVSLATTGGLLIGLCYVHQPIIQGERGVGAGIGAGIGGLFRRLGQNLRLCMSGGLVLGGLWLALMSWSFVLALAAAALIDSEELGTLVLATVLALSWLLSFPVAPIWAALAYRRQNDQARRADELERRIRALLAPPGPPAVAQPSGG